MVSAPWLLFGSLYQLRVIVDPLAVCQVPEPDVKNLSIGPAKSVSPTVKAIVRLEVVVLISDSDEAFRVFMPGLAGVPVEVWIDPLI